MSGEEYQPGMDIEEIMRQVQEKIDAQPPDGHFAEYQGEVAFSVLEQVMPIRLADAPEVIHNILQTTPWGAPNAPRHIVNQVHEPSSVFNRAIWACFNEPSTTESGQVFNQLNDCVEELPVDILGSQPTERSIWIQKIAMSIQAYGLIKQKEYFEHRAFGTTSTTAEMQAFTTTLESRINQAQQTIGAAQETDLLAVIQLLDTNNILDETCMLSLKTRYSKTKILRQQRNIPEGLYEIMGEARTHAVTKAEMDLKYTQIEEPLQQKLEQLQDNWTWRDINQIVDVFPTLKAHETQVTIIDALEDAAEVSLANAVPAHELASRGFATLIHLDIYKNLRAAPLPIDLILDKDLGDSEVTFGDITLPREMAPMITVALLTDLAKKLPAEEFATVLGHIQEVISDRRNPVDTTINEWLVTLALLRMCPDDHVREQTDAFIAQADFPHAAFQSIITGQKPGNIYLMPGGKIRVDANLSQGWILAKSSFVNPVEPSEPAPLTHQRVKAQPRSNIEPHKGNVVVPGKQQTKRERKKARAQAPPKEAMPAQERRAPVIILPRGENLESLGESLSPVDLAVVTQAIQENQEHGRHPLTSLRRRTAEGALMCKMRVNSKDGGIRVILVHVGGNRFKIQTIKYRSAVYKTQLFD